MARTRYIKPAFFKNEDLAECSFQARLLFAGLWCFADRNGRMEFRARRMKADVFPYDDADIESLAGELERHGFVNIYENGGRKYLQVVNFSKHQRPHRDERAEDIPAPDCGQHEKGCAQHGEIHAEHEKGRGEHALSMGNGERGTFNGERSTGTSTQTQTRSFDSNATTTDDDRINPCFEDLSPIVMGICRKTQYPSCCDLFWQAAAFFQHGMISQGDLESVCNGTRLSAKRAPGYFRKLLIEVIERRGTTYAACLAKFSDSWPTGPPREPTASDLAASIGRGRS